MPKVDSKKYQEFKKGMFGGAEVETEEETSIQDVIQRLKKKAQDLLQGDSVDTDYKNKILQISHGDKKKAEESSLDTPEKRRAATRRLLQKMQEGPVPDMNTEKGVENPEDNAIVRQLEGMEEEEPSLPSQKLRKGRPSSP